MRALIVVDIQNDFLPGGALDLGTLASGLLGLGLMLAAFAAAGLFMSSLTEQPTVAAISRDALAAVGGRFLAKLRGNDVEVSWESIVQLAELSYRCTLCRRCAQACPVGVDNALITREIRKLFSQELGIAMPDLHTLGTMKQLDTGSSTGLNPAGVADVIEFAEEDTDKVKVRAVETKGSYDIDTEQERFWHPELEGRRFYNWLMYRGRGTLMRKVEAMLREAGPISSYRDYVASLPEDAPPVQVPSAGAVHA